MTGLYTNAFAWICGASLSNRSFVSLIRRRFTLFSKGVEMTPHLASWNDTPTKQAIVDFVAQVSNESSPNYVPPEARIAVYDNDGTLWCEKPMPIQADFILRRLAAMAEQDPALRDQQPWKAAYEKDYAWLDGVIVKHYHGDESDVKVLLGGVLRAFEGITIEAFEKESGRSEERRVGKECRSRWSPYH